MEAVIEKDCSALGGLFQTLIGDMKSSYPVWEDFITKAGKLQSQLRATVAALAAFLDAFQRVADLATNSRGGTRDIGSALTRMCMRHRSIEAKFKQFSMTFLEALINPLQDQMEEWKRGVYTLDKDHAKEYKRARQEIKKKSSDTLKLQKKAKKAADTLGRGDILPQLDCAMQDVSDKYILLEEIEKEALRKALIEERQRFCSFVAMLRPVVDEEISMLAEVTHLQAISDDLKSLTSDPQKLPPASEQVILDLKGSDYSWSYQTPPSSPSTTTSRKSSMCSLNSVNSSDSRGSSGSHSHSHSPSSSSSSSSSHHLFHHHQPRQRYRSSTPSQQAPARLSSISSHDSGFISSSHDQYASSKPSSPMPAKSKPCGSSSSSDVSESGHLHSDTASAAAAAAAPPPHTVAKLSNGFDHHSPANSPTNGGSLSSGSSTAFPFFPPSSTPSSCPTRPWPRPASALLPDCPMGSLMVPSSRVPSWKDWAKPGPYDQPMVNTLRKKKDKGPPAPLDINGVTGRESGAPQNLPTTTPALSEMHSPQKVSVEEKNRTVQIKPGEFEAHDELALALSRGLELDGPRSSRDSVQCSSGYNTQTNTPCCSEDTIPSQVSDYDYFSMAGEQDPEQQQSEFDKSSTIPRNSDIGQSYRRMFQTKRPASTAGLPSTQAPHPAQGGYPNGGTCPSTPTHASTGPPTGSSNHGFYPGSHNVPGSYSTGHGPVIVTPGVATIRRTPSSKPSARRSGSVVGTGPIPIRTPVVPVKIPTVPDMPGVANGSKAVKETGGSPDSPTFPRGDSAQVLPVASWSGRASTNPPTVPLANRLAQRHPHSEPGGEEPDGDVLVAIRNGVKLKRTLTNDRSAPRIA
ncbi:protein MTSS 1-like isoform X2 [Syngnathoides biaculeatus]|uniref:protein MTSS 1-like isoform X2 n=1 Tax=Syngnathoides biaculeatus TaxID=300417 RepID=UPI002ADDA05A|nr:protein MTSS 1-like isoform X2 [Syngnathoides biaculeatus]